MLVLKILFPVSLFRLEEAVECRLLMSNKIERKSNKNYSILKNFTSEQGSHMNLDN